MPDGRQSETKRAKRETFFLAQIVGNGSGGGATGNASDQRATRGPADACRVQMKQPAQISNRAADHDVVVAKQQTAKRGDTWPQ